MIARNQNRLTENKDNSKGSFIFADKVTRKEAGRLFPWPLLTSQAALVDWAGVGCIKLIYSFLGVAITKCLKIAEM